MPSKLLEQYKVSIAFGVVGAIMLIIGIAASLMFSSNTSVSDGIEIVQLSENALASPDNAIIIIDIQGAVDAPGVYRMEDGTRVSDLLIIAGGLSEDADYVWFAKNINQAQPLVDGAKIFIPSKDDFLSSPSHVSNIDQMSNMSSQININSASAHDLESLSGIGEKTSAKIIEGRPYSTIDELVDRKIVGKSTFEKVRERLSTF